MKKNLKTFLAAALLAGVTALPLWAQIDVAPETDTNQSVNQAVSSITAPPEPDHELARNIEHLHPTPIETFLSGMRSILVPLAPFVMVVAIILVIFYFKHRRHQMMNETLRAMIDKGQPITPELLDSLKGNKNGVAGPGAGSIGGNFIRQRNDLRTGVILMGVGLGILFLAGKPGWIVFFIGLAYLVVSRIERNKPGNPPPQPPQPPQMPQPPTQ